MMEWIPEVAEITATIVEALMVVVIFVGTIRALYAIAVQTIAHRALAPAVREIWLHYAAWILLALEFALAADLIRTVLTPSWPDIGMLAAIAAIRIVLGYFLGRDIDEVRESGPEKG